MPNGSRENALVEDHAQLSSHPESSCEKSEVCDSFALITGLSPFGSVLPVLRLTQSIKEAGSISTTMMLASEQDGARKETRCIALASQQGFYLFLSK